VEENARHVVWLGLPPLAVPELSPVIGISVCILVVICGNLSRFPESTWKEREVYFPFAVSLVLFFNSLIRSASHRQRACYTLAPSLVRQTQLIRLTWVSVADYTSSVATRDLETQTHPHGPSFYLHLCEVVLGN